MSKRFIALIPCAGNGSRFGSKIPKQYSKIGDKTILEYSLQAFLQVEEIAQIVVVASAADEYIEQYIPSSDKIIVHYVGGDTRAKSVINGLSCLSCDESDWILVHDAARCCITPQLITDLITQLSDDNVGGILAIPATDTIKAVKDKVIERTIKREMIYLAQTPQMFRFNILWQALSKLDLNNVTDEASAVERLNLPVKIIQGSVANLKVTYPLDLKIAELILTT